VKISLGTVQASTGDHLEAISNFEDAIELCSQTGDIRQQAYALSGAAHVYLLDNDPDTAKEYLDEALRIFENLGEKYKIATVHLDLGRLHLMNKEYNQMRDVFDGCLKIMNELKLPFYYDRMSNEIVSILKKFGRFDDIKRYKTK
jgi:tetratricopeptide (TPR) repeat protein